MSLFENISLGVAILPSFGAIRRFDGVAPSLKRERCDWPHFLRVAPTIGTWLPPIPVIAVSTTIAVLPIIGVTGSGFGAHLSSFHR